MFLFVLGIVFGIRANFILWDILDKVNGRLPESERFSFLFIGLNILRLLREYRRFYPDGKLIAEYWRLEIDMGILILGATIIIAFLIALSN
jgi:hypothetical protein